MPAHAAPSHAAFAAAIASVRANARRAVFIAFLLFGALLLLRSTSNRAAATSVPELSYEIETFSGTHHHVQQAIDGVPTLVDVDGDAVTDVDVALSFVNLDGVALTSNLANAVGADVTITQNPTPALLRRPSPPLTIIIKINLFDPVALQPTQQIRLGYETGPGGSIPSHFDAALSGLQDLFNPLHLQVDTVGGPLGLTTDPSEQPTYTGPLTLLAGIGLPTDVPTDVHATYQPFPGKVELTYGSDSSGTHIAYAQTPSGPTRLHAHVTHGTESAGWSATADIDQLPSELSADISATDEGGTSITLARSPGATMDARLAFDSHQADGSRTIVTGAVSGLPESLTATWQPKPFSAAIHSHGGSVGGVDLRVHGFPGTATLPAPPVPAEQQFLAYQSTTTSDGDEWQLATHADDIHDASFGLTGDGFAARLDAGDGADPFGIYLRTDNRADSSADQPRLLAADAHLSPLPSTFRGELHLPSADAPIHIVTDTSAPTDLAAHVQLVPADVAPGCGAPQNLCAGVRLAHIPSHVDVRAGQLADGSTGIDLDAPRPDDSPSMKLRADVSAGVGTFDTAFNAAAPLYAHVEVDDLPQHLRVHFHNDATDTLDGVDVHACDWKFETTSPACDGDAGTIGQISFSVRNFAEADRPSSLPPPTPTPGQFASLVARQADIDQPASFQLDGRIDAVTDAVLRNVTGTGDEGGVLGVQATTAGGNLSAHVDIDTPSMSLLANTTLTSMPSTVDFCLRSPDTPAGTTTDSSFTTACENDDPFGDKSLPAEQTSFAVHGSSTFGFDADARYVAKATDPSDDDVYAGAVSVPTVPSAVTVNMRAALSCPKDAADCTPTPLRLNYSIPSGSPAVTITASGRHSHGNSICDDPRDGAQATCFSGTLQNVPTTANVCYDASNAELCGSSGNLTITAGEPSGGAAFNLSDLRLSTVAAGDVLIATGDLVGIPQHVTATVANQGVLVHADAPGLGSLRNVTIRNYIAPDPFGTVTVPAQRKGLPDASSVIGAFVRGDKYKITATLNHVTDGGLQPSVDATGALLGTQRITMGFDAGRPVRAYADIVGTDSSHLIGDVTVEHNPAALSVCFRGADPHSRAAVHPTWCDATAPNPAALGALEIHQTPASIPADVHAFIRQAGPDGSIILSGVADAVRVPPILRASFGDGTYEATGLAADGTTRQGIGDLSFDVASFDLPADETGYVNAPLPAFTAERAPGGPFPAQAQAVAYLAAAATDTDFQARGEIGSSGAHLQHLLYTDAPCARPGSRSEYPFYPRDAVTTYTCVRADFTKDAGAGPTPLRLSADLRRDGARVALSNAGLTDVPAWLQATIAQAPALNPDTSLRRRCGWQAGSAPSESYGGNGQCVPPLLRFDAAHQATPAVLYGTLSFASSDARADSELATLTATGPRQAMLDARNDTIDLGANPAAEWAGDTGVRLRVGTFQQPDAGDDTAISAGIREQVPGSLTVDQLQSYRGAGALAVDDGSGGRLQPDARCLPEDCPPPTDDQPPTPPTYDLMDLRAHFVARNYGDPPYFDIGGQVVPSLGNLEALITSFGDNGPESQVQAQNVQNGPDAAPVPGDLGIDVHERGAITGSPGFAHNKLTYQVRLSTSAPLNLKVHVGYTSGTIGALDAVLQVANASQSADREGECNVDPSVVPDCLPGVVNFEMIQGPQQLHFVPPDGPSAFTISKDTFHIKDIAMHLGMGGSELVNAVVHLNGAQNGLQIDGYSYDRSNYLDEPVGTRYRYRAPVTASGRISFDHFDFDLDPADSDAFSVDIHLHLKSTLDVGFSSDTSQFLLEQNILHIYGQRSTGTATIGPVDLTVPFAADLTAEVAIPVAPNLELTYNPPHFDPPPLQEAWEACPGDIEHSSGNSIDIPNTGGLLSETGSLDRTMEPIRDPRISLEDSLGVGTYKDTAISYLTSAMCSATTAIDLADAGYPSDPVDYPQHALPDMGVDMFETVHPSEPAQPAQAPTTSSTDGGSPADTTAPVSALVTVPSATHGEDGEDAPYREQPFAVLLADDEPAGTGVASIHYQFDGAADVRYTTPIRIGPGTHTLHWYATDRAGNVEARHSKTIKVDDRAPTLSLTAPQPDGDGGWYRTSPAVTLDASDPDSDGSPGSGVAQVFASLDGAAFTAGTGAQTKHIPDGIHTLYAYATDQAGHRSATVTRTFRVDTSVPTIELRTTPPAAAVHGWWRLTPSVHMSAADVGSGVGAVEYSVDGGTFTTYTEPFDLPDGAHIVKARTVDLAGNAGAVLTRTVDVDSNAPAATATSATPALWIPLLGPAKLRWTVADDLGHSVHVQVIVLSATGDVARILDGGTVAVTPGTPTSGFTPWDGRDGTLTGLLPIGTYTFEVVATDEAGNVTQSGYSLPIQLKLL